MSSKNATRKRGSKAVAQARGAGGNRVAVIAGVVVVAVLAAVVVGAVIFSGKEEAAQTRGTGIPVVSAGLSGVPAVLEERTGTVVLGKAGAPVVVDVYEDFLCPICGTFEEQYDEQIDEALTSGKIKVRYHVVNLLDAQSKPAGYSLLSASAALSVAKNSPDRFADFHASLFAAQPREGGPGYTADQIVALGKDLQVGGSFEQDVRGGAFDEAVKTAYKAASTDPALQRTQGGQSYFGTPTVASGGALVDISNANWLADLVG
ncbi:DsbA family protein [Umezawaea sp.]|uniref:DsbA family protein n=1 Tax=Umezawaea sp. TaxID=1955258 RepID=UPI002ED5D3F9